MPNDSLHLYYLPPPHHHTNEKERKQAVLCPTNARIKFWVPIESEIFMYKLNKTQLFLRKYEKEIRAKLNSLVRIQVF